MDGGTGAFYKAEKEEDEGELGWLEGDWEEVQLALENTKQGKGNGEEESVGNVFPRVLSLVVEGS